MVLLLCFVTFALCHQPWTEALGAIALGLVTGQLGFQLHDAGVSPHVAFGAVAQACGYARVAGTDSLGELTRLVSGHSPSAGPTLVHFRVRTGALPNLGRPRVQPAEVSERLMRHLHAAT